MTRRALVGAIRDRCLDAGFHFHTGSAQRMAAEMKKLPAVWLLPPKLTGKEGLYGGVKHYRVELNVVALFRGNAAAEREEAWAGMEDAAMRIVTELAGAECVKAVSDVECAAAEVSVAPGNELAMEVKFRVRVPYDR